MKIGAVILAAGAGTRLGGVAKALLGEPTFLSKILGTAREVGLAQAIVVVGPPHGEAVAAHAIQLGARVVENPAPERGMASSVALGFAALLDGNAPNVDSAWLWPVDHPDVAASTLRALIDKLGAHAAARPVVELRGGHPPLIARSLFPALAACTTLDGGARTVLAAADTIDVPVGDRACLRDIDTPTDLEAR
jgi:CTP:molybdopterin cytidylyltransferase MocA